MSLFLFPHTEKKFMEGFSVPGSEICAGKWSWLAFYFHILKDCNKELLLVKCIGVALMMIFAIVVKTLKEVGVFCWMSYFEHTINLRWVCHLHLMVKFSVLDPCLLWAIDPEEKCHKGNWFGIFRSLSWFLCSFAFVLRLHISFGVKITCVQQLSSRMPRPAFSRGIFTSREHTL